jgi:tetratricopeptide (TPR) repeat protein
LRYGKLHHFLILFIILGISGCATTNQAPFPVQQYSDLTSRYNAYFNAKEKMKIVLQSAQKTFKDDYKEVIPVYFYTEKTACTSFKGDLEDIEKRCEKSIQIHKYSNFVDDHFLMIARANFLKGDYDKSIQNLRFVTTEYKDGVDYVKEVKRLKGKNVKPSKKKKPKKRAKFEKRLDSKGNLVLEKVDERPRYSIFVHEPARAEAMLWMAKAYTAKGKFNEAASIIQYTKNDDQFYKNLDNELLLVEANLYIAKKDWSQATLPLELYLAKVKKKKFRLRPAIALAQIYERLGDKSKSVQYYAEALKSNPGYDAEFFTQIQQNRIARKGKINIEGVKKALVKMSRDGKYTDYLDQIYFELGEIANDENNRPLAREWYKKSVASSTSNVEQKSLSYLRLANMDYDEEIYTSAKFYYDSTLIGLPKKDTAYGEVAIRASVLGKLVEQLTIITTEDSLQRLAKMSVSDRERSIKKIIADSEKKAEKESQVQANNVFNNNNNTLNTPSSTTTSGAWYFSNSVMRANGFTEFTKRWGQRKLEENWRRKSKTNIANGSNSNDTNSGNTEEEANTNPGSDIDKMIAGLPMTAEKISLSDDKLIDAFYTAGVIYKSDLKNNRKANQKFDELNKRFPKSRLTLETYYQLYLLGDLMNKNSQKQDYRSRIINEYPDSKFAKFLQDPSFFEAEKREQNALNNSYQSAYVDYEKGLFASAIQKCKLADVEYNPNPLKPKFDLLNALVEAKQNRLDDYIQSLNKIILKHKATPEAVVAESLLATLNSSQLPMKDLSKEVPPPPVDTLPISVVRDTVSAVKIASIDPKKPIEKPKESTPESPQPATSTKDTTAKSSPKVEVKDTVKVVAPQVKNEGKPDTIKAVSPTLPKIVETINSDTTDQEELYGVSDNAPHMVILYYANVSFYSNDIFSKTRCL